MSGGHDEISDDIRFWSAVFNFYTKGSVIKFKAVGGKKILIELARLINGSTPSRTIIAMDRDCDRLMGTEFRQDHVIYTHGYSWENDIWKPEVIEGVFRFYCPGCQVAIAVSSLIEDWYNKVEAALRWPVYADYFLLIRNISFQGIRAAPESVIVYAADGSPLIDRQRIKRILRTHRGQTCALFFSLTPIRLRAWRDCYGHFIDGLVYRLLISLLQRKCKRRGKLPREAIHSAGVSVWKECLSDGKLPEIEKYYESEFSKFSLARAK